MVTIYHFDLPKDLQTFGGFTNSLLVEYFEEYANLLFSRYGDRVKFWLTLNEPAEFCVKGYGVGLHAPGINAHGIGEYLCGHNALKAHAVAYRHYKNKFYDRFKGKVGIGCDSLFYYSASDPVAADRAMQFSVNFFFIKLERCKNVVVVAKIKKKIICLAWLVCASNIQHNRKLSRGNDFTNCQQ